MGYGPQRFDIIKADPYSDRAWSDPVRYDPKSIDPDLFWDDGRAVYVAIAGTNLQTIDLKLALVNGRFSLQSRGVESGWYLPRSKDIPGDGPFANDSDVVDFQPNSTIPRHFDFWRWPNKNPYAVSPPAHPGTLQLTPSLASITAGYKNYSAGYQLADLTLIMRRQTDTMFEYSVDVNFTPKARNEERPAHEIQLIGQAPATIVSDGAGLFTGSLVGVYATNNGGSGATPSYISRWRYRGIGQAIAKGQYEIAL
ncbi:hypothetical protein BDV23DRAFT_183843 [Aspergillus alliaceus]|uniref:PI-PLC Y-box domain-containing protein n=1 Tax=Petromyces alliaceus TaxID=209559 RepID=A0A5N7C7N8_PETAA|nr:hypothetical protein BDV23DRAFT_183843 [Aspergillus alliaceus]